MNILRLSVVSVFIGIACGVAALAFYNMLKYGTFFFLGEFAGYYPPSPGFEGNINWISPENPFRILFVLVLGGIFAGLIVYKFAPEAEGHGTDAAIRAFHRENGYVRRRIPIVKMIASTLTISSGGSAGREGPIAHIGSGVGSAVADFFRLSVEERRIALAVGIGAGVGSIFKAPLGGALLSAEILYKKDFEKEALIPAIIASVVGYTLFGYIMGFSPVFRVEEKYSLNLLHLPLFLILGMASACVGVLYVRAFYTTFEFFRRLRLPKFIKPAIGSLLVGVIVVVLFYTAPKEISLGALSMGYGFIQLAIDNRLAIEALLALVFLKILFTSLTIGSGGSGGVFAPGLFIGAMLGGFLGKLFNILFPDIVTSSDISAFVIVGMMSLFGGVSKAPIAVLVMIAEMTKSYELLFPAMVSIVASYLLTGEETIYREQVSTRLNSPAHVKEYFLELLKVPKVLHAMRREFIVLNPKDSLRKAVLGMKQGLTSLPVFNYGKLIGYIKLSDITRVNDLNAEVSRILRTDIPKVSIDEPLLNAIEKMDKLGEDVLFVFDKEKFVGVLVRSDILKLKFYEEVLEQ